MLKRLLGAVFLAVFTVSTLAGIAAAVEEGTGPVQHELPEIDEVGTQSETAREYFPDEYESPTVFPWFGYALLIGAGLLTVWVLLSYLVFQPRFAGERQAKQRR